MSISPLGFPRSVRLLASEDFRRVFAKAARSSDHYFTVLGAPGSGEGSRLGLAIAKKQVRSAVDRNRLKRLAREVFRAQRATLGGLDLVVMARHAAASADSRELAESLRKHFTALSVRTESN